MTEQERNKKRRKFGFRFWMQLFVYVFLAVTFIVSAVLIYRQYADFMQSIDEYKQAREIAGITDMSDITDKFIPEIKTDTESPHENSGDDSSDSNGSRSDEDILNEIIMECLRSVDIKALKAVNPDVIGWIYITATDISYPIMHSDSNERYIRSSWMNSSVYLTAGAIFMESMNNPEFSDFNTILYGHRMRNETMFGKIKYYNSKSYLEAHPYIYIVTESDISRYDIYAAYEVSTLGDTFKIGLGGKESRQAYIDFTLASSIYSTGIVPTVDDHILTLTTCSGVKDYSTRWVVQAVKVFCESRRGTA